MKSNAAVVGRKQKICSIIISTADQDFTGYGTAILALILTPSKPPGTNSRIAGRLVLSRASSTALTAAFYTIMIVVRKLQCHFTSERISEENLLTKRCILITYCRVLAMHVNAESKLHRKDL